MSNKDMELERKIADHLLAVMALLKVPYTESTRDTPKRIAKMWNREVFANRSEERKCILDLKMKTFPAERYSGKLILVKDIPFSSMCEHHFMPFMGKVSVGYVPDERIVGLSKIPRIVEFFSKKPQLQERYTDEIARYLLSLVSPHAVFVEVQAKHTCVSCRGIELPCETVTYAEEAGSFTDIANLEKWRKEFNNRKGA